MVAYSFNRRFIEPIRAGRKSHTIRAPRKRHARPGEDLQLYAGMRTRHCELIGRAVCGEVLPITFLFSDDPEAEGVILPGFGYPGGADGFAVADGFQDWNELREFWRVQHPAEFRAGEFSGVMITWREFTCG